MSVQFYFAVKKNKLTWYEKYAPVVRLTPRMVTCKNIVSNGLCRNRGVQASACARGENSSRK